MLAADNAVVVALGKRAPVVVLLGGGLVGWIALRLAVSDPAVAPWIELNAPVIAAAAPALGAALVVAAGVILARRRPPPSPPAA